MIHKFYWERLFETSGRGIPQVLQKVNNAANAARGLVWVILICYLPPGRFRWERTEYGYWQRNLTRASHVTSSHGSSQHFVEDSVPSGG